MNISGTPFVVTLNLEWRRFGQWCAHLYLTGEQVCKTQHGMFNSARLEKCKKTENRLLVGGDLTQHGFPFGRVCRHCEKVFFGLKRIAKEK